MSEFQHLNTSDLQDQLGQIAVRYRAFRAAGHQLNLGRGKPSAEQLDLSNGLLRAVDESHFLAADGTDCRNYGGLQGLPEVRALFSGLLGAPPNQIVVGNNASLSLMHDTVAWAMIHGVPGGKAPWLSDAPPTFLCPVPGYDRHFTICEGFGIRMLPVPLTGQGPDVEIVQQLVAKDPSVKGMWCVPKYSNPTGELYSPAIIERLASMPTAAPDFRLFWDNAYGEHHLTDRAHEIANVLELCARHGHPERAFVFASTSKMTFAGAGLAMVASSPTNVRWLLQHVERRTIGPDKLNQLRHVRFLRDEAGIAAHMARHASILAPKFNAVQDCFKTLLGGRGVGHWTEPEGGYFISLDVLDGCAARVIDLAKAAGIVVVPPGSTFPHGRDPRDRNIRVAPSYPTLEEVRQAADGLALSVLIAAGEAILRQRGESLSATAI